MSAANSGLLAPTPAVSTVRRIPWGFAEVFVISQTALPALLYLPGTQVVRLPIRASAFAISLVAFAWWQIESTVQVRKSKAQSWVAAIMGLLAVMLFHPTTPSIVGGLAHVAVYFAVMAPLFWAPVFVRTPEKLARILWILLICSGLNAMVGVLQVYDPGRWMPAEFTRVLTSAPTGLGTLTYSGPNGERLIRPPGLFDTPGAVAGPAMVASLLGLVFAVSAIPFWKRATALVFAGAGVAAIYLSHVRISLVMTALTFAVYVFVTTRQRNLTRATKFATLAGAILFGSFLVAVALGGETVRERVMTLFAQDPITVYQGARGTQLTVTFRDLLFEHPLGAGLARWGMAASYFGSYSNLVQPIWAEIQLTGWMIDGGVLLVALYSGALAVTMLVQWRLATTARWPKLATCAGVVLSANVGTAALIFTFTPFVAQIGIQYWFLAGALHGVAAAYDMDGA